MSGHVMGLVCLSSYLPDDEMTPLAASWPGRVCEDVAIVTRSFIFIFTITYEWRENQDRRIDNNNNDDNDNTVKAVYKFCPERQKSWSFFLWEVTKKFWLS